MKILVLEDNKFDFKVIHQYLKKVLSQEEVEIRWAKSLDEALEEFTKSEKSFDLILTDLGLPDADGLGSVEKIKLKNKDDCPVIVLSGTSDKEIGLKSLRKGADDYLVKQNINYEMFRKTILYSLERFKLHQEVQVSQQKVKAANQVKSDFLSNMSHEIRTPLNLIVGTADLLSETNLDQTQKKYVDTFKKASDHLLNLINDILDYSKIEGENLKVKKEDLNFEAIMEDVADIVSARFRMKHIDFRYSIEGFEESTLIGDKKRIFQILLNCISNSFKFTDQGFVEVQIRNLHKVKSKIARPINNGVEILIKDSGRGIKQEKIKNIFDSFYQIDNSSVKEIKGTGLGLSIVQKLVALMSGSIDVKSAVGEGTQFRIQIPLPHHHKPTLTTDLKGCKYLILSSKESENQGLFKNLTQRGAQVSLYSDAHSFQEDLETLDFKSFSKMYFDAAMPELGGIEIIENHIPNKYWKDKCVIILPSIQRQADLEKIESLAIESLLFRPLKGKEINRSLQEGNSKGRLSKKKVKESFNFEDYRILVVDDDPDNRDLASAYLKNTHCQMDLAENGFEAIELFETSKYDLILMDIQMPEMNGYMTTEKIRAIENNRNLGETTIVGLSANSFNEDIEKARNSGFNGYIPKPVKRAKLLEHMAQLLLGKKFGHDQKEAFLNGA